MAVFEYLVVFLSLSLLGTCSGFSVPCWLCVKVMDNIHEGAVHNSSEKAVVDVVEALCIVSRVVKPEICKGAIHEFYPVLREVMSRTRVDTKAICSEILQKDCGSTFTSNWTVEIPGDRPAYKVPHLPKAGSPVVRVVHLADPHVDHHYSIGSNVNCGEPICCHAWQGKGTAGKWGDPLCDAPVALLDNLLQHIQTSEKFDYVLWTGDIPPHDVWNQTRDDQISMIVSITKMLRKYLPDAVIYPAVGNHEGSPVNVFAPEWEKGQFSSQWLFDTLAETWSDWLPESALATVRRGGFYSIPHSHDLRIISLNFNFCEMLNFWLYVEDRDPYGQLQWLVGELTMAERRGEKVHIIGHIPPGVFDCLKTWSRAYNDIVRRFQNTIVAQFYGHTHKDELQIFFSEPEVGNGTVPNGVAYVAPSVTTYSRHFPAYRVYEIDGGYSGGSWHVLDHFNYMCNLTDANLTDEPKWELEYSAREAYGLPSLFPHDWFGFATSLYTDDELFRRYWQYYQHAPVHLRTKCTGECRAKHICNVLTSSSGNHNFCKSTHE